MVRFTALVTAVRLALLTYMVTSPLVSHLCAGEPQGALKSFAKKRNWSDTSGRFKIEAELSYADQKEVRLKQSDGQHLKIPLTKLSEPDRAFVESFLETESISGGATIEENPFTVVGNAPSKPASSPFRKPAPSSPTNVATGDDMQESADSGSITKRKSSDRSAKPLQVQITKPYWRAPNLAALPNLDLPDQLHALNFGKPFFAGMRTKMAGTSGVVVTNVYQQGRSAPENYSKFSVLRLKGEEEFPMLELPESWKLMAISPDGRRFAAVRIIGHDKGSDVAIFSVTKDGINAEFQFTAGGGDWDHLEWIDFLPNNRLATISQKQNFTVWDLASPTFIKAVLRCSVDRTSIAHMNVSGELLAITSGSAMAVFDTKQMKQVGCLVHDEAIQHIAFSPDGKRMATFAPFSVSVFDLSTGNLETKIVAGETCGKTALAFLGNNHLLAGDLMLDIKLGMPIWTYNCKSVYRAMLGNVMATAFDDKDRIRITVLNLPDPTTMEIVNKDSKSDIYSLVPGGTVSISYSLSGLSPNDEQAIKDAVKQKIEKIGWKIMPVAAHKIKVSVSQGEDKTDEYYTSTGHLGFIPMHMMGGRRPSGPAETVHYKPWNHEFVLSNDEGELFKRNWYVSSPQGFTLKDGESTQQAVTRLVVPYPQFFTNLLVPTRILSPKYREGVGKSNIDENGLHQ